MPVAADLLAVENAVLQAARAGCKTIWVVGHRETQAILRHRMGDFILDQSSMRQAIFSTAPEMHVKEIPIYYVPIHPKDRDRRDCLAWSVIYGALRAFHIANIMSRWVVPDKYFVSFPYGLVDLETLHDARNLIRSRKNFYVTYRGKSIRDGEYLPFTFDRDDFIKFRRVIREGTGRFVNMKFDSEKKRLISQDRLPLDKQHSARFFTLDKVFGCATIEGNNTIETPWYHSIDSWEKYVKYMGSPEALTVERPRYFTYKEWNPISKDKDEL